MGEEWVDGHGVAHLVLDPPVENTGVWGELGTDGSLRAVHAMGEVVPPPVYGGDVSPDGHLVLTGVAAGRYGTSTTLGAGTDREVTLDASGSEPDGFVAYYDPGERFRCAWALGGFSSQIARDAAFDGEGGFVVVGRFNPELVLRDADETVLLDLEKRGSEDGFVLRFAPPAP